MTKPNNCYIRSVAQVSCQQPLCDDWLTVPHWNEGEYAVAVEPQTRGVVSPVEARRMGKILKRAVCTSLSALGSSGIEMPDAIITGTGMGCMENSEKFLADLTLNGEHCLKPTLFMQSTHNTISSMVAMTLKCHGYNNTYSHGALSFDSALLDAWLQLRSGSISHALIGAHDEVTPPMARVMRHIHPEYSFVSETSMASVLSVEAGDGPNVVVEDVCIACNWSASDVAAYLHEDDTVIIAGINGKSCNDKPYMEVMDALAGPRTLLKYKHVFGDNFSAPAMAFYVGATLLARQEDVPGFLFESEAEHRIQPLDHITLLNNAGTDSWSVVRLRRL